jgi:hypothetical protein
MNLTKRPTFWIVLVTGLALGLAIALMGCTPSGPTEKSPTPKDLWISAHPTHSDERGLCREFDDEPCDEDPYDLDDFFELDATKTKAPSAKPKPKTTPVPKPKTTRR